MNALYEYRNRLARPVLFASAGIAVACLAAGKPDWGRSLLAGTLTGMLNFWLLSFEVARAARTPSLPPRARMRRTLLRYGALGLCLAAFFSRSWLVLPAYLFGLFGIQAAVVLGALASRPGFAEGGG